jgi:hypothetical protein
LKRGWTVQEARSSILRKCGEHPAGVSALLTLVNEPQHGSECFLGSGQASLRCHLRARTTGTRERACWPSRVSPIFALGNVRITYRFGTPHVLGRSNERALRLPSRRAREHRGISGAPRNEGVPGSNPGVGSGREGLHTRSKPGPRAASLRAVMRRSDALAKPCCDRAAIAIHSERSAGTTP